MGGNGQDRVVPHGLRHVVAPHRHGDRVSVHDVDVVRADLLVVEGPGAAGVTDPDRGGQLRGEADEPGVIVVIRGSGLAPDWSAEDGLLGRSAPL